MILIEKVEISYFRSIYALRLKDLTDLSILSGKNDCGKSNILKALNLFFNNETDWKTKLDFSKDFSLKRLEEVRRDTIKGRQFIRVKVFFIRGNRSNRSLPEKFSVTRTWYRDSSTPETKSSIERNFRDGKIRTESLASAQRGLQQFLNRIRFEYVPAVKDRNLSNYMLGLLQDTILERKSGESTIIESIDGLNKAVEEGAVELNDEFRDVCGITTDIRLPQELAELFRAFSVYTGGDDGELPITMRGDGIQTRFISSLLNYVAQNSKLIYLWGFEEPENCLEHTLATDLSYDLRDSYSNESQILLTSHSPAFLSLDGDNVTAFRIFDGEGGTSGLCVYPSKDGSNSDALELKTELGLLELEKEHQEEFERRKAILLSETEKVEELREEISKASSPILLTEGKTDATIIEHAWDRLYSGTTMRFRVLSCSTTEDGSTAGVGILSKHLESCRQDMPITIGLFDRDDEGIRAFENLDKNFKLLEGYDNIKVHKNNRAAAFLIPAISGKEEYIKFNNLPIEFVFPEEAISKQVDGKGLECEYEKKEVKVGKNVVEKVDATEPHFRKIKRNSKTYFAEKVVPELNDDDFEGIKSIIEDFKTIKKGLKDNAI
jgi:AAA15 family ATPase/GTPase